MEPARYSENKPFKKQKVVTQKTREKCFKKKEMVSSVEGNSGASEVSSRFGNYQMVKLARAVSVEWGKKKSGFKCRVKSKSEGLCQMSPCVPSDPHSTLHHSALCPRYKATSTDSCDSIEFGQQ